jgi:X-Pro dipeptidyl-peptidase C-terminal non-catalytic domain
MSPPCTFVSSTTHFYPPGGRRTRGMGTANRAVFDLVFAEDTDTVGNSALRLFVEAEDTTEADIFVGVEKLDTDGNEVYFFSASGGNANGPVIRGWLRASKRALNQERSADARPVLSYARRRRVGSVYSLVGRAGRAFRCGHRGHQPGTCLR